jgi:3-hydroxybutyryl-CoA dehydrogenase
MHTIVIGNAKNKEEFSHKFPRIDARFLGVNDPLPDTSENPVVIWDFAIDDAPERLKLYKKYEVGDCILFANVVRTGLHNLLVKYSQPEIVLVAFNGLPTFFDRTILELSIIKENEKAFVEEVLVELKTEAEFIGDRVGMISPRVVCMIINEAYYTLQEGTANKSDIDKGMKLGTNYPMGPFEWAEKIGLGNVYQLLNALWEDTKEERYKICPLLKKEAQLN